MEKETRKCPFLYHQYGKKARDLLTGYHSEYKTFQVSSSPCKGLTIISKAERDEEYEIGTAVRLLYSTKKALRLYNIDNNDIGVEVQIDAVPQISGSVALSKQFLSSTTTQATIRFPDYDTSKLNMVYLQPHAALSMSTALNRFPAVRLSASIGTPSIALGMELGITSTSFLTSVNAGFQVTRPSYQATILLTNKGDKLKASYFHGLGEANKICAGVEMIRCLSTNENLFLAGGSLAIDDLTVVKARIDSHGKLKTLLKYNVHNKTLFSISADLDTKDLNRKPEIGLAFGMKF